MKDLRVAVVVAVFTTILAGCGGTTTAVTQRPRSTATLKIVQPAPAAVVTAKMLHVEFKLTGGKIVNIVSKNLTTDEGHIHLTIDGHLINMNYKLTDDVSLQGFAAGPHDLQGEFVALDHAPFDPRVMDRIVFDYEPSSTSG